MARLLFGGDDVSMRGPYGSAQLNASGRTGIVYADATTSALADIVTYPGGAAIAGSVITVTADSQLPLFQGPNDGSDTVWVSVDGGTRTPVYTNVDARLDLLAISVGTKASVTYVDAQDAAAISTAETFATGAVGTETSRAMAAEATKLVAGSTATYANLAALPAASAHTNEIVKTLDAAVYESTGSAWVQLVAPNGTYASAASGVVAAQATMKKIARDRADVNLMLLGDSTGVDIGGGTPYNRWFHQWALLFMVQHPEKTVVLHTWDDATTQTYATTTTLQTGTGTNNAGGPFTIHIYNGSVSGAILYSPLSAPIAGGNVRYPTMFQQVAVDLLFVNFGANQTLVGEMFGQMQGAIGEWLLDQPQMDVIVVNQAPTTTDTVNQQLRATVMERYATMQGVGYIDVQSVFLAAGNPSGWYESDGIHPNATGSGQFASIVAAHTVLTDTAQELPRASSPFSTQADSILLNSDFGDWNSATNALANWTTVGGATLSRDTTHTEEIGGSGFPNNGSVAIAAPAANAAQYMTQTMTVPASWRGKTVTVMVRRYIPTGANINCGYVNLSDGVNGVLATPDTRMCGAFHYAVLSLQLAPTATQINLSVQPMHDATQAGGQTMTVSRICAVRGGQPRELRTARTIFPSTNRNAVDLNAWQRASHVLFETVPRRDVLDPTITERQTVSGTLEMVAIYLPKGLLVSKIGFLVGTVAAVTPTHGFFALFNSSRALLANTNDLTTGALAARTQKLGSLTGAFTTTYTGLHYLGFCSVAATNPTLQRSGTSVDLTGDASVLCGTSSTGLAGTTASVPNPAAALTAELGMIYGWVE